MNRPLLHSRVRESIELAYAPVQVLEAIQRLEITGFELNIDDSDPDNILFEMVKQQSENIVITGMIRRWQGTDSRLDYQGEVGVPETNFFSKRAMMIVLAVASVIYPVAVIPQQSRISLNLSADMFYGIAILSFGLYIYVIYRIARGMLKSHIDDEKRWQLQQELATVIELIRNIEAYVA